jgi:hypothetical protein
MSVTAGAASGSTSSSPPGDSISTPQPRGEPAAGLGPHHAAGGGMLGSIPSAGSGVGALGSGDWVCSTVAAEAEAVEGGSSSSGAASRVQQSGPEEGSLSEDLPTSPVATDALLHQQQQQQHQGVGGVSRSGSGAGGSGVVRTDSGARGSKGRQSKLGAVPLRRRGEGASAGCAHSSSGGGGPPARLAGSGGSGGAEALAAAAAATMAVPAQHIISSGSGGVGGEVTRGPGGTQPSGTAPAPAAATAAAGPAAPAAGTVMQDAAVAQQVSGDDMGSGLGWASPPDRHMPAAAASAVHRARGHQQQHRVAGPGQQDEGQQDRKDW